MDAVEEAVVIVLLTLGSLGGLTVLVWWALSVYLGDTSEWFGV